MSDSFDGFDENDHFEIGDAMRRLTGPTPSTDDAFTGFRRRVRRARIQRTAATVGAAAAVATLALGIPALVNGSGSNEVPVQSGGVSLPTDTSVDGPGTDGSNDGYNPAGGSGTPGIPNGESGSTDRGTTPPRRTTPGRPAPRAQRLSTSPRPARQREAASPHDGSTVS